MGGGGGGGGGDARFWSEKAKIDRIQPTAFASLPFATGLQTSMGYRDGLQNDTMEGFGVGDPVAPVEHAGLVAPPPPQQQPVRGIDWTQYNEQHRRPFFNMMSDGGRERAEQWAQQDRDRRIDYMLAHNAHDQAGLGRQT